MTSQLETSAWLALRAHQKQGSDVHLRDLFAEDLERFERFSLSLGDMLLDYSKNRITPKTCTLLCDLAREAEVEAWRDRMFAGDKINTTENRAALHVALRNRTSTPILVDGKNVMPLVRDALGQMRAFVVSVRGGIAKGHTGKKFTDFVNIGIGGSDLGPAMVCEALTPYVKDGLRTHFVSNVDATDIVETLKKLNPETTLFIITSKSFTTQETMANAEAAKMWITGTLGDEAVGRHFVAISENRDAVQAFGIDRANHFPIWEWVGGRYSLWSAVGLPIALTTGMENFEALLDGAHAMDRHFIEAPIEENMPMILALMGIWNINCQGAAGHTILPYDQYLRLLPGYLQQADMESNGKGVGREGEAVTQGTSPIVFGAAGTVGQHSFYQLLHQGPELVTADFIAAAESHNPLGDRHEKLLANCFAQAEALMRGKTEEEVRTELEGEGLSQGLVNRLAPHKVFPGNRPSNSILVRKFDPHTLGKLIALYEHKIFIQGVIWGINSFDQWGVELGKVLADDILPDLMTDATADRHDASTNGLINAYQKWKSEIL
ncbi:MAG: glucose-6-phosphate isomerase [Rhodospirillaceae bacterium]|jgi:glucose-6-phosphate isomerase|nr:glucose-6-phosphate isomerase [Rhodospirillales bacterium]MBT3906193.1 glucose-6-phosphate isomerase [Rhodospirillaceae bacterium]MBT4702015.1 glucose-6-phosphate isomerase [Rhodospirillaceae bacterium]MBT5034731.1 glucose-6-phosphate isomerase [Rhodospirillaceae bacterium]MBT6221468.1 glucose-6-phosphate isomerase [Rhodospirillaceae bacterium]